MTDEVSRGVEEVVEVGVEKMVVDSRGIKQVSRNKESDPRKELDRSTRYREAIEEAGAFLIDPPGIEELS